MKLVSYFNPLSNQFHAFFDFKEKLSIDQKVKAVALTVLSAVVPYAVLGITLLSLPISGLIGLAAFRWAVEHYIFTSKSSDKPQSKPIEEATPPKVQEEIKPKIDEGIPLQKPEKAKETAAKILIVASSLPTPLINEPKATEKIFNFSQRPILTKQFSRTESLDFNSLAVEEILTKLRQADTIDLLKIFWQQMATLVSAIKGLTEEELVRAKLKAILKTITETQFDQSVEIDTFWKILLDDRYYEILIENFRPAHFETMTAYVRSMLLQGDSFFIENYNSYEKRLITLIGLIPTKHKDIVADYLTLICPHAMPNLETGLDALIRKFAYRQSKELKAALKKAVDSFPQDSYKGLRPSPIKEKNRATLCKRKTEPAPQKRDFIPPDTFKIKEKHVVKLEAETCLHYISDCEELKQVPKEHQEDLFFWILQNLDEPHFVKKKKFALDYFFEFADAGSLTNAEKLVLLAKFTDNHLQAFVKLLDTQNLFEKFIAREKTASQVYSGLTEIAELKRRLSVELKAFSKEQIFWMLESKEMWALMTDMKYKQTFADSLTPEQCGWFAEWLATHIMELQEDEDKPSYFGSLIQSLPADTTEQKALLKAKASAILPHALKIKRRQSLSQAFKESPKGDLAKAFAHSDNPILTAIQFMLGEKWVRMEINAIQDRELAEKERQPIAALEAAVVAEEAALAQEEALFAQEKAALAQEEREAEKESQEQDPDYLESEFSNLAARLKAININFDEPYLPQITEPDSVLPSWEALDDAKEFNDEITYQDSPQKGFRILAEETSVEEASVEEAFKLALQNITILKGLTV